MSDVKTPNSNEIDVEEHFDDEWFDLLPVEQKLLKWSLSIGLVLLAIFILIFRVL